MKKQIPNMGCHLILDFHDSKVDLDNLDELTNNFTKIIVESGATIESVMHKRFEPQGVSILYLLSESHFSIHTWPEFGACAIDFYHCGETARIRMEKASERLKDYLGHEACTGDMIIDRGNYRYSLHRVSETESVIKKKFALDGHQMEEPKLEIDNVTLKGFTDISNIDELIECEKSHEKSDSFKLMYTKTDISSQSSSSLESLDTKDELSPKILEETTALVCGLGDLSFTVNLTHYFSKITVYHDCSDITLRLNHLKSNNMKLSQLIESNSIVFVHKNEELLGSFDSIYVLDSSLSSNLGCLESYRKVGSSYFALVENEMEFDDHCKHFNLTKIFFINLTGSISRFLIGKAKFS